VQHVTPSPVFEVEPRHEIAGAGERGHPVAVDQLRVPADVIDVEVRADHIVDFIGREIERGQMCDERRVEVVEVGHRRTEVLAVTDARVDDDAQAVDRDEQGLHDHPESAVVGEIWLQPVAIRLECVDGLTQERLAGEDQLGFGHHRDRRVADFPTQ
jgi:hypothetical protein